MMGMLNLNHDFSITVLNDLPKPLQESIISSPSILRSSMVPTYETWTHLGPDASVKGGVFKWQCSSHVNFCPTLGSGTIGPPPGMHRNGADRLPIMQSFVHTSCGRRNNG